jgi:hypothetical protein
MLAVTDHSVTLSDILQVNEMLYKANVAITKAVRSGSSPSAVQVGSGG